MIILPRGYALTILAILMISGSSAQGGVWEHLNNMSIEDATTPVTESIEGSAPNVTRLAMVNAPSIAKDPLNNSWNFVVSVEAYETKGEKTFKQCLGVAITVDAILTAGHCLTGMGYVRVKFISNPSPIQVETIEAKGWAIHPMYNGGHSEPMYSQFNVSEAPRYHDIAVVLLKKPTEYGLPIKVVPKGYKPDRKRDITPTFYVFGHARNEEFIKQDGVMFATFHQAKSQLGTDHWFTGQLAEGVLICTGDSGSPITVLAESEAIPGYSTHYLVGIQTSGDGGGRKPKDMKKALTFWKKEENLPFCTRDFSFIDVEHHVDWIREKLEKLDPETPRDIQRFGQ